MISGVGASLFPSALTGVAAGRGVEAAGKASAKGAVEAAPKAGAAAARAAGGGEDTNDPEVQREIARLRARDQEVRAHEAAHIAAGGSYIRSAANYTFTKGPDGRQYATGGEVSIDVSPVAGDPQATIAKMTAVRAAALAPAQPSSADIAVANAAAQQAAQAQAELAKQSAEKALVDVYAAETEPASAPGSLLNVAA